MKLNRMKLIDWRNHAETEIVFGDKLTVIRGANHSGKSSVQQGIEFALTGRCDATDAKGTGAAALIRQGAEKSGILIRLRANKEVMLKCVLTEKSGRTVTFKDETDPTYTGEAVKEWLDSQKPVLSCLLNNRYFIGLKPAEQKTLLSSIILPDRYDWPDAIKDKCSAVHLGSVIPWQSSPFETIEAAYKLAFEKRRDINRDLKNLLIPDSIAPPEGVGDMAALRQKLATLRADLNELGNNRFQQQKARSKAESEIRALETRIESLEAKIKTEQAALAQTEQVMLSAKQVKDLETTAGKAKELAKLEAKLADVRKRIFGVDAMLATFNALDGKKCCPTCSREVTDDWLTNAMKPHVDAKNSLANEERDHLKAQGELGDIAAAKRKLEENERSAKSAQRSRDILGETDALLKTSRTELEGLQAQMPAAAVNGPTEEETALRGEIAKLEAAADQVAVADARAKEIDRAKTQHKQLAQASATLDELVKYFGKDGVKAEMLSEHIGGFTAAMNEVLAGWGYACSFEIEPYGFRVTNIGKCTTLALELLSGSERLRFSVAFQVALAQVSGIRMVIVDEADMLDSEGRGAFYPLLLNADLDQAIAIGTSEIREVPDVAETAFYMMADGGAERLSAQEEAIAQ